MVKKWAPSFWGRQLTGSPDWRLRLEGLELSLTVADHTYRVNVEEETTYRITPGRFWTDITLHSQQKNEINVDGLPNVKSAGLTQALNCALARKHLREDEEFLSNTYHILSSWLIYKNNQEQAATSARRWFTHEMQSSVEAARPSIDTLTVVELLKKPEVKALLGKKAQQLADLLSTWKLDQHIFWTALNEAHTKNELNACKELFDRVESKPLTEEQARAVICFDNRVQVIAAAGSGKTSTMVAKAAYAIYRGIVDPERIVLLAFNKKAAEELKDRARKSFERLGMEGVSVEASTFHSLGLHIIGKATGEKPDIPEWATATSPEGFRKLNDIVNQLKDRSPIFCTQWDLFRFVFGKHLNMFGSPEIADVWDEQGNGRICTIRGESVKSQEECMIANWLFYNGVEYHYEEPYKYQTANEDYRQYKPDFYYPEIKLYHEHFALDKQGLPPANFDGYLDGVHWKRKIHREMGTELFETTSYGLREGNDFKRIESELTKRGIILKPNSDREVPKGGQKPMESQALIGLVCTFISHLKSNCLTIPAIYQRLDDMPESTDKYRYQMFLNIAVPIMEAREAALAAESCIDFEDMLNLAAEYLESGRCEAPYELVMADEFQDSSQARARLCRALVQKPGRFLFAVGDDWQSINRFAGADVSVMTRFLQWFGHGQVLKLERTFRCPQVLCNVSSTFISKNPNQIPKQVHSLTPAQGPVLTAFQVDSQDKMAGAIDQFVMKLAEGIRSGSIQPGQLGKVSVYILGRYNNDRQYVPGRQARFNRWVDVSFLTIHRSKGSEADYVILPNMVSFTRGRSFPNTQAYDPVLTLAMPDDDNFPLGEERRLFYVALTRARRSVAMFTVKGRYSTFLNELKEDGAVSVTDTEGKVICEENCPVCKQGVLVLRSGAYGEFRSCSNYPACKFKPKKSRTTRPLNIKQQTVHNIESSSPPSLLTGVSSSAPVKKPGRLSFGTLMQSVMDNVENFSRTAAHLSAVQISTLDLKQNLNTERIIIEAALKGAKTTIRLEEYMKDPLFKANYQQLSNTVDFKREVPQMEYYPVPKFQRAQKNSDPETEAAIQRSIDILRKERESFLTVVHDQLSADPILREYFIKKINELGGAHYLSELDPINSWSKQ
ncbi:UvrD-helicase domain-containing protein [Mangrovibacter phragmitis]|uniref:UvrD-helicase domain-containing protein n=1 Tax=Mangrovibacter phragmitis TaxID=1691903 RepID=UPI00336AEB07